MFYLPTAGTVNINKPINSSIDKSIKMYSILMKNMTLFSENTNFFANQ